MHSKYLAALTTAALTMLLTLSSGVNAQDEHPVITPENAGQLAPLAILARGQIRDVDWLSTPTGNELVVAAGGEIWIYNADDLSAPPLDHLEGFDGGVSTVKVRPDNQQIAFGTWNGDILLRDVRTGLSTTLTEHQAWNADINYSPDGKRLTAANPDGMVQVWNIENGALLYTLTEHSPHALAAVFSPDGKILATGGGNAFEFTNLPTPNLVEQTDWLKPLFQPPIPFLPDQVPVLLWDAETGEQIGRLYGPHHATTELVFSPDSKRLAANTLDGEIHVWNVEDGEHIAVSSGGTYSIWYEEALNFTADGSALFYATRPVNQNDVLFQKWDYLADEHQILDVSFEQKGTRTYVVSAFFNPDYSRLVIVTNYDISFHNAESYEWLDELGPVHHFYGNEGISYANPVFSPDGTRLALFDYAANQITLWDTATQEEIFRLPTQEIYAQAMIFNADGTQMASSDLEGTIHIWDIQNQTELMQLRGHQAEPKLAAFSPNGRWLASASTGDSKDGTVRIWSLDNQSDAILETTLTDNYRYSISALTFSPDNRVLAVRDNYLNSRFYDVVSHRELSKREWRHMWTELPYDTLAAPEVEAFQREVYLATIGDQFHANGTLAEDVLAVLWPEHVGRTISGYLSLSDFWEMDSIVVTNISLNNAQTRLTAFEGYGYQKIFSPDANLVISITSRTSENVHDTKLSLWNTLTGEELWNGDLSSVDGSISSLVISPDGRYILTGMFSGTIKLWGIRVP